MEKILFSNVFNQTEYLRTLAKIGCPSFGLRVLNDSGLCSFILEHGEKMPEGTLISSKEEDYIYFHLGKGDYGDAVNLRMAIDSYRDSVIGDVYQAFTDNLSDDFKVKKDLIRKQYLAYQEYKEERHLYDKIDLINYLLNSDIHLDMECQYYYEMGISQLFLALLNHVFTKVTPISLSDTFPKVDKEINFVKAYGKPCEADYVFSHIEQYPIDECQIIVTKANDALEIMKTAEMLSIPYTSSVGTPCISSKAGILLKYLFDLEDQSFGVDGYRALFNCEAFNKDIFINMIPEDISNKDKYLDEFIKDAGWLRLNFDSKLEDIHKDLYRYPIYLMLKELQTSLSKGRAYFIGRYILNPQGIDESIIDSIAQVEEDSKTYCFEARDVLAKLLESRVNKKVSKSGCLYITDINHALSSLRKHNFIIGLNSDFPGGPKENYLIFDEEYEKTGCSLYISKEKVKQKEAVLRAVIDASKDLYLSYSYFDLAGLEDNNPSSIIFDLYPGDTSNIPNYEFKDIKLSINREVYKARIDNLKSALSPRQYSLEYNKNYLLNKEYSPSMFHSYFEKETKLSFLLSAILDINITEEDDPYQVIASNDKGTLIHEVMQKFQKDKISLDDFIKKADKKFDEFLIKKPALIPSSKKKAKEDYLRLVTNLYNMDPGNQHIESERYLSGDVGGIKFHGTLDRLEKDQYGQYIIADYKTGRNVNHKKEDVKSCFQGLIYAYLVEHYYKTAIKVHHIEFRYPETGDSVHITYTPEHEQEMLNLINEFITDINNESLFNDIIVKDQRFIDKYHHLFSLLKEVDQQ